MPLGQKAKLFQQMSGSDMRSPIATLALGFQLKYCAPSSELNVKVNISRNLNLIWRACTIAGWRHKLALI